MGQFSNDHKTRGIANYKNGDWFNGDWKNDKPGNGKCKHRSSRGLYEGDCINGFTYHGQGKLVGP